MLLKYVWRQMPLGAEKIIIKKWKEEDDDEETHGDDEKFLLALIFVT